MNWDQVFEDNGYKPAAPPPMPALPDPGICENHQRPCNEPFVVDGQVVGYCSKLIGWRRWWLNTRREPNLRPHNGPHHFEWWS